MIDEAIKLAKRLEDATQLIVGCAFSNHSLGTADSAVSVLNKVVPELERLAKKLGTDVPLNYRDGPAHADPEIAAMSMPPGQYARMDHEQRQAFDERVMAAKKRREQEQDHKSLEAGFVMGQFANRNL